MSDETKAKLFENGTKVIAWKFNPLQVAIAGGADAIPEGERGPLDTATNKEHPLYDERLKTVKMTKEWVANINASGVLTSIKVVKYEGLPFVVDGRERVRGARLANALREAEGKPAIDIKADVVTADTPAALIKILVAANVHFEDTATNKIAKLQRLIANGVEVTEAATYFGIGAQAAKAWLQYDEKAIPTVKKAVASGKIPQTVGADIARLGDEKVQQKALDKVLETAVSSNPNRKERKGQAAKARRAIAEATGKNAGVSDKKTLKKLLAMAVDKPAKGMKDETVAWWRGVADTLSFILGGDDADERLTKLMSDLDSASVPAHDRAPLPKAEGKLGAAIDKVTKKAAAKKAAKATPATTSDADNEE
jgi:ParB family transcriptional regulator, chromosome partitioning protein